MTSSNPFEAVYALTRHGEEELRARGTSLANAELEILVRMDGHLTLQQIRAAMQLPEALFASAFQELLRRSLVREAEQDAFTLDFLQATQGAGQREGESSEVALGLGSLKRKGYYVRIARRGSLPQAAPDQGLSLLVVEDEVTVRTFLQTLLKLQGFQVRVAATRAEVVAELNSRPAPDLVLLDVELPDVNGFDVLTRMKAHPVLRSVPVMMLTGADTREAVIRGLAGGAEGYITKPVDPDSLLRAVAAVLGRPEPTPEDIWRIHPKDRKYQ